MLLPLLCVLTDAHKHTHTHLKFCAIYLKKPQLRRENHVPWRISQTILSIINVYLVWHRVHFLHKSFDVLDFSHKTISVDTLHFVFFFLFHRMSFSKRWKFNIFYFNFLQMEIQIRLSLAIAISHVFSLSNIGSMTASLD